MWWPEMGCSPSACGGSDLQGVTADWDFTLVGVLPNVCRGRSWHVEAVVALSLVNHSTVASHFLGRPCFLQGISGLGVPSLPYLLLSLYRWQQSSPWICFLNPTLYHSAPTCVGRFSSQAGMPRADSWGGCRMGGAQDPGAAMGRGGFGLRDRQGCSDGHPSQCPNRSKPVEGDESYSCSPTPCAPLISVALLLWYPGLCLQTFLVMELFTLIPSGCFFTANSCPLSGSALQTPLFSTSPHSATRDTQLKLGFAGL